MEVDDEPLTFRDCYHYKENDMAGLARMSGRQPSEFNHLTPYSYEKYTFETNGAKVYTTKSPDNNSVSIFRSTTDYFYTSKSVQEKTFSIKRIPNHPIL